MVQWLGLPLPLQGTRVPSLVGELKSHMPRGIAKIIKIKKHLVIRKQKAHHRYWM